MNNGFHHTEEAIKQRGESWYYSITSMLCIGMKTPWNKGRKQSEIINNTLKERWRLNNIRKCPQCNRDIVCITYEGYWYGVRNNSLCKSCQSAGKNNAQYGVIHDVIYKRKMSKRLKGTNNPMYGLRGSNHPAYGYRHTPETKEIIRQRICNRMLRDNCLPDVDSGATEYFDNMNLSGSHIRHPNVYLPCGYFVDGYDPVTHIVYEYDTKYHTKPNQLRKDDVRQGNIMEYFNGVGNPLTAFVRIKAYDDYVHQVFTSSLSS